LRHTVNIGGAGTVAYQVKIRGEDKTIAVDKDETILEAAIAADIDYPCACQSGTCGTCKSQLLAGEVEMTDYSDLALTDGERAQGQILACSAFPLTDCEVAWLEEQD
jgi:CDP-4-dehydro-6-deoxyglucose reductase/ferredoxin-NAD(P)+ reductase (naphthalene dioxygenase ferredoxin-specific)